MAASEVPTLNPNTAEIDDLVRLPGIGPQLAERIVDGRPYAAVDDLHQVPGLGESVLNTIEPYLIFETEEDARVQTEAPDEQEPTSYAPLVIASTSGEDAHDDSPGVWALLAVGAASIVCAVSLTLAILAGINRTLNVGRHSALEETRRELRQISTDLESTRVEIEGLRARTEALEGVSGRMVEVETQIEDLRQQVGMASDALESIRTDVDQALEETRSQAERVNRFQAFLDGLGQLIGEIIVRQP